jgi:peptide/nickel transport system permease protein
MSSSTWKHVRYVLSENPVTLVAAALFALFVAAGADRPVLVPYDPLAATPRRR